MAANLLAGLPLRAIAEAVGASLGTVFRDKEIIVKRWKEEQMSLINGAIELDLERINHAINAIWTAVKAGNLQAIDRLVKLQEQRARLLLLDKPQDDGQKDDSHLAHFAEFFPADARAVPTLAESPAEHH